MPCLDYYQGYSTGQVELLGHTPHPLDYGHALLNRFTGVCFWTSPGDLGTLVHPSAELHLSGIRVITLSLPCLCYLDLELDIMPNISIIIERYHGKTRIQMLSFVGLPRIVGGLYLSLSSQTVAQPLAGPSNLSSLCCRLGSFGALSSIVPYNKEEIHESEAPDRRSCEKLTRSMLQLIFFLAIAATSDCMYQYSPETPSCLKSYSSEPRIWSAFQLSSFGAQCHAVDWDSGWNQLFSFSWFRPSWKDFYRSLIITFGILGEISVITYFTLGGSCRFYPGRLPTVIIPTTIAFSWYLAAIPAKLLNNAT